MVEILIVYSICHLIGDYYLQSSRIASEKANDIKAMLTHSSLYLVPFGVLFATVTDSSVMDRIFLLFFIGLVHFIIDTTKVTLHRSLTVANKDAILYVLDQSLHILVYVIIVQSGARFELPFFLQSMDEAMRWGLYLLLLGKPVNVTFTILFSKYKPKQAESKTGDDADSQAIEGAGRVIGNLERFLMAIMIGLNQFTAIGFVLTAKSIARYDKISKSPSFAEYFLIGTLFSTIATILLYIFILG